MSFYFFQLMNVTKCIFALMLGSMLSNFSYGQSLTGTTGLIKIPTGEFYPDKTFSLGATYIPKGYYKRTYGPFQGQLTENADSATFVSLNLLPSIEVMFRFTHEFGLKVNPTTGYFPDRMFTVRWQLFKEGRYSTYSKKTSKALARPFNSKVNGYAG